MHIPVSVIIPCYNVVMYIEECLESVICQKLENIEIICVDDCSADETSALLEFFAARHSHIRLYKHDCNRGLSAARNTGLLHARSEFVFFLDADDILPDPLALSMLYKVAIDDDADQVLGRTLRWYPETGVLSQDYHKLYQKNDLRKTCIRQNPELCRNVIACNKLIKRDLLERNSLRFDENIKKFEDNIFSCALHTLSTVTSYVKFTTYYHRQRTGGMKSLRQSKDSIDWYYHYKIYEFYVEHLSVRPKFIRLYKVQALGILKKTFTKFFSFFRTETEIESFLDALYLLLPEIPASMMPPKIREALDSLPNCGHGLVYDTIARFYSAPNLIHLQEEFSRLQEEFIRLTEKNELNKAVCNSEDAANRELV